MTTTATTIETGSPDLRGAVLAHVLRHVVTTPGPVTFDAVFRSTLAALGKPEEECGREIMDAALLLARSGLIVSAAYADGQITIADRTTLTAAPLITGWVWRDADGVEE